MTVFDIIITIAITLLSICMLLVLIRFVKGPDLPDRVSAFDLFSANIISITILFTLVTGERAYMDVALILAMISFLGALSFAYFIMKKN